MKARYIFTVSLAFICLFCGCSSLTPIRTYTSASQRGLDGAEALTYNFETNCLATCRDHDLEAYRLTSIDCDCKDSKNADSINTLMYNAIYTYIIALKQLSGKDATILPIPAFSESLQASPLVNLKINQKEIDAYTTIADLLGNAISGHYRKNKLKAFVSRGQSPLNTLIDYLQLNLSKNLNGLIEVRIQRNKLMFYEYSSDKRYLPYQRREITASFYKIYDHLETEMQVHRYFTQVLEAIKEGHNNLYNHLDVWNSDQLTLSVNKNAATIDALLTKMEELK